MFYNVLQCFTMFYNVYYQAREEWQGEAGDKPSGGEEEEVIKRTNTKADRDDIVHIACMIQLMITIGLKIVRLLRTVRRVVRMMVRTQMILPILQVAWM